MFFQVLRIICLASCFCVPTAVNAVTLNLDASGQLLGASGIDLGGKLWDVSFLDGNCVDNFSGCDDVSDFAFNSVLDVYEATEQLYNQVLLGATQFDFTSNRNHIRGCADGIRCLVSTPYIDNQTIPPFEVFGNVAIWNDAFDNSRDRIDAPVILDKNYDYSQDAFSKVAYVEWSLSDVTAVPLPAAVWQLALALFGLASVGTFRRI